MLTNMLYVHNLKMACISCHLRGWHREISQKASVQCETALQLIKTQMGPLMVSPLCYKIKFIPANPTDVSLVIQQFHTGRRDGLLSSLVCQSPMGWGSSLPKAHLHEAWALCCGSAQQLCSAPREPHWLDHSFWQSSMVIDMLDYSLLLLEHSWHNRELTLQKD